MIAAPPEAFLVRLDRNAVEHLLEMTGPRGVDGNSLATHDALEQESD